MRILFVGGTGNISSAVTDLVLQRGHDLTIASRGTSARATIPQGVRALTVDVHQTEQFRAAIHADVIAHGEYDAVVQWIGFDPDHVSDDIATFDGITKQYVFISSASAYETPPGFYITREERTPLTNPFWAYSRDKAEAERRLRIAKDEHGFPYTVVRPSHTYGYSDLPAAITSWTHPWTWADRLLSGKKILVHGDGTSLWTITDHRDFAFAFVGLLGKQEAVGEEFHITSDEVLSWNQIHAAIAGAVGVSEDALAAQTVYIPTDLLVRFDREAFEGPLKGDKANCAIFDNSKVRTIVPDYRPEFRLADSMRRSVEWFMADASRRTIDTAANDLWDRVAANYERGVAAMFR